jgi:long-chain acyl-CoA synthetase
VKALFLDERILEHARAAPNAPAVGTPGGWQTYEELASQVQLLAASLQARRIGPGTFVLNLLPNGIASVGAGLAIQRVGACLVEINRDWGSAYIANIARITKARHAFVDGRDRELIGAMNLDWEAIWWMRPEAPSEGGLPAFGTNILALDERGTVEPGREPNVLGRSPDDLALLLFTSASMGQSRGVMLSHRNIAANSESIVQYLGLSASDRVMSILPLSYSYGRSLLQTHLWVGGSIFFDHRFMYPRLVLESIARERCTGFAGVPMTFQVLRRNCNPRSVQMPSLRYVTQAGGAMTVEVRTWVRDAFAPAQFYVMYGQTEATARLAYLPPERFADKPNAVGIAIPGVELRVVDDEGRDVAVGVVGNLVARGDNVSRGYFEAPEETREILKAGWLWTGDLALRDADGYFFIAGRKRAMLKVSGHRFSPEEVEHRLSQHPAVDEACVVGAPDPVSGEVAWAFVVLKAAVDSVALRRFCAETLPTFKVPKNVVTFDALPRSPAGKVRRAELEEYARKAAADFAETLSRRGKA